MPRRPKRSYACEHFNWNLFTRDGIFYADGRGNAIKLGKHSLGTTDKAEAEAALRELDLQMAVKWKKVAPPKAATGSPLPLADAWKRYLDHAGRDEALGGVSPATLAAYRNVQNNHLEFCRRQGFSTWNQFDKAALAAFYKWQRGNGLSGATAYFQVTVIKQACNWLVAERLLGEDCRLRLAVTRPEESSTFCFQRAHVDAMLGVCRGEPKLRWLGDVILALAMTGMRVGEAIALSWAAVDLDAGFINVRDNRGTRAGQDPATRVTTKGKRSRRVPIHPDLMPVLRRMANEAVATNRPVMAPVVTKRSRAEGSRTDGSGTDVPTIAAAACDGAERPQGRVFRDRRGRPLKYHLILTALRGVIKRLASGFPSAAGEVGFADGAVHGLRHFFVSQAFVSKIDEGTIRSWVGHRTSRIIERYRHLGDEDSLRKMSAFAPLASAPAQTLKLGVGSGAARKTRADRSKGKANNWAGAGRGNHPARNRTNLRQAADGKPIVV